ncbi:type IV pilus assembly protein PilY1 [Simplicispira sp. 125]|nr:MULTISPECIES: PilC/PilY family type IV pilus protein [unclassified Simplicispira]PVY56204.1 type IV pilus assembly protein PilY1 [Simplicispira sp. 125]REG17149.1 type IV pilus assembly protein PilY1 [Simplicispira sp. 110]
MPRTHAPRFPKSLLALAASAALIPQGVWALDLADAPPLPTSKPGFVAPNLLISIDDSGSMGFRLDQANTSGATNETAPVAGAWPTTSRRMNILKHALTQVFSDTTLTENGKLRIAWQAMHNNGNNISKYQDLNYWYGSGSNPGKGKTPGANDFNTATTGNKNKLRILDDTHRANFLSFVSYLLPQNGTPSHPMFAQADTYMRDGAMDDNSPWASVPGTTGAPFLGCRRNYHIMMTDGRWNDNTAVAIPDLNYRDNSTNLTLPNSAPTYGGTAAGIEQTALYRDTSSDSNNTNTLADWAFYSWAKPLKTTGFATGTDIIQTPKSYQEAPATKSFSYGGKTVALEKFWNPEYNPATWPHMVTYTIGFSTEAVTWKKNFTGTNTKYNINSPTAQNPFGYDGDFPGLVTGKKTWPEMNDEDRRALDLWHSALNGRGRFYAVTAADDLKNAFKEIIGKINEETAPLPDTVNGNGGNSGSNVSQNNVATFYSVYSPKQAWKGWVQASPVREPENVPCPTPANPSKTCPKFPDPTSGWNNKTTADLLDAPGFSVTNRLVLSWSDKWASTKPKGGVPFKWADDDSNLSADQKALLGVESSVATAKPKQKGLNVLNFIRGERDLEGVDPSGYTDADPFRERKSRQGDIVNSEIWYTGTPTSNYSLSGYGAFANTHKSRTPMLYVGGNDGMLHGFSATDGTEKIAYVPRGLIGKLKSLSDPIYNHQYYVDGSPMTGDVSVSGTWSTMLVGTLGAGGKGYFVLNVTDPANFASASPADLIKRDRTRGNSEVAPNCSAMSDATEKAACLVTVQEDEDIGNIVASPVRNASNQQQTTQITRMNNDRWAVIMGNGYNSTNQRPVLLVQYLDGAMELKRIHAIPSTIVTGSGNANDNGLAAPAVVDVNGDGRADVVYAGDNLGNLWKFDLTSDVDTDWKVAFGTNTPLFTASGPATIGGTRNLVQPITAPPIVAANDRQKTIGSGASAKDVAVGGLMVAFGTGRNLTEDDRKTTNTNIQTLYSVLDNTRYRKNGTHLEVHPGGGTCPTGPDCVPVPAALGAGVAAAKLAKQTIATVSGSYATVNATEELKTSTWKDYNGWYLDLPASGERLLKPMQFFDGSNILAVYSESPTGTTEGGGGASNESCSPSTIATAPGAQYRTLVNIMDGKIPKVQLVDINGDHIYDGDDKKVARAAVSTGTPMLITKGKRILDATGKDLSKCKTDPTQCAEELNRMPEQSLRPSWRQLK